MKIEKSTLLFSILSFIIPFLIFAFTKSSSLMFDDAAEFALVISLGSIAHPPGTPAYIFFGRVWNKVMSIFSHDTVAILSLFSAFCVALAAVLFYLTLKTILEKSFPENNKTKNHLTAFFTALAFATGATTWAWANTVEVYAFQMLAMAILLFGLVHFHFSRKNIFILVASFGYALGLSNHHLTIILFTPFILFFFPTELFVNTKTQERNKKKKVTTQKTLFITEAFSAMKTRSFILMFVTTSSLTFGFYFWMYLRAQHAYPFSFGKPDSLSGIWYHITGGNYSKNLTGTSKAIISARVPYFLELTFLQFLFFFPFLLAGIYEMMRKKLFPLLAMILFYFTFLFVYQINDNQWSSTDAYMLLPFFILTIPVAFGIAKWFDKLKLKFVLPVLLALQLAYNFPLHDKRNYNVSESLLNLVDKSCPKNSIVLISDWSLVIQCYYARIVENFRPDLIVLNYDIKFTEPRILQTLYPEFYETIKPEYETFLTELGKEHPEELLGTGCDLSTVPIMNSFKQLIHKIEDVAKQQHRMFLTDPKAHYFFTNQKIYNPNRYVSGCFVSDIPSTNNDEFLQMKEKWLDSPLLLHDPSALDKMVDFQAMLDNHIYYFTANKDSSRLAMAVAAKDKVLMLQRKMKKEMSFAYKLK